jgi:hypothetical protein
VKRWFGRSAFIALAVFITGRLALEPLRTTPQFDSRGMEAYDAVETYQLRKKPERFQAVILGSSIMMWDVIAGNLAEDLNLPAPSVRKLATAGGTPFDMWNMVRQNPERFSEVTLALVEVNPFILRSNLDDDPRLRYTVSQHATLGERRLLASKPERLFQMAEWALPVGSVRRSLRSAFLNILDPEPHSEIFPHADIRSFPSPAWGGESQAQESPAAARNVAQQTARRLVSGWKISRLQDRSLRSLLAWLDQRQVRTFLVQAPVGSAVVAEMMREPRCAEGYARYAAYLQSLRRPEESLMRASSEECGIPETAFHDTTHLNRRGATLFSRFLAAEIKKRPASAGPVHQP